MRNFVVVATAAALMAVTSNSWSAEDSKLIAKPSTEYGTFVADAEGKALYMFTADKRGDANTPPQSDCYGACAEAWPPLLAAGDMEVMPPLKKELLGTVKRKDGTTQVTYGGWPLYYFVEDRGTAAVTGQRVHTHGGEWYLVSPDGTRNRQSGEDRQPG